MPWHAKANGPVSVEASVRLAHPEGACVCTLYAATQVQELEDAGERLAAEIADMRRQADELHRRLGM